MLKTDFKKEIESTLDLVKIGIDKDLIDGDTDSAFKKVDRGMKCILGLDMVTVNTLSFDNVMDLVGKENQYNSDRYMALGELLYLEGCIYEKMEDESSKVNYYKKSLKSFYAAYCEDNEIDERYKENVLAILDCLSSYEMDLNESDIILKLYEYNNAFDKAEDVLFYMIKKSNKDKSVITEGIKFYNRLKEMDEDILDRGNLPIDEVNESLSEVKEMLK